MRQFDTSQFEAELVTFFPARDAACGEVASTAEWLWEPGGEMPCLNRGHVKSGVEVVRENRAVLGSVVEAVE